APVVAAAPASAAPVGAPSPPTPPPQPPVVTPASEPRGVPASDDSSKAEASPATPSRIPAYVMLGIGGAGAVVTGVFGVLALGNKSSLDSDCTAGKTYCPASSRSDINSMHVNSIISDVGLGVAVAGLGAGGVLLLANGGSTSSGVNGGRAVQFEPWVGLGSMGMRGSF
ncbi:MAG: hypothetical protein ACLP1X_00920, partial [Polyangiaceae bacterium]